MHGDVFMSASGDTSVRLWDLRQPQPTLTIAAHAHEVRRPFGSLLRGCKLHLQHLRLKWSGCFLMYYLRLGCGDLCE